MGTEIVPKRVLVNRSLEVFEQQRAVVGFAFLWLLFVAVEVGKSVFFTGSIDRAGRVFLYGLYLYLPWFLISICAFYLAEFTLSRSLSIRRTLLTILPFALFAVLLHITLLTASYWIFWPQVVERVTFSFVFVEQSLQWSLIELFAFYGIVIFWRHHLSGTDRTDRNDAGTQSASLCVSDGESLHNLTPDEIEYVLADDNYVIVNTPAGQLRVRGTLKEFLANLRAPDFMQTHRSALVNISRVKQILPNRLVMVSGDKVPISRRRHKAVSDACVTKSSC